jgi:hypothetical protein
MVQRFRIRAPQRTPVSVRGKLIVAPTVARACTIVELSNDQATVRLDDDDDLPNNVMLFEAEQARIWECVVRSKVDRAVELSFIDACNHAVRRELLETPSLGLLKEEPAPPADAAPQPQTSS